MKRQTVVEKYKGKNLSLASIAKKISDKYGNRDTDAIQQRSFLAEMNELMRHQEMMKLKESAGKAIKNYRQPVEASSYAKKALGGGIDPVQMFNVGQAIQSGVRYQDEKEYFKGWPEDKYRKLIHEVYDNVPFPASPSIGAITPQQYAGNAFDVDFTKVAKETNALKPAVPSPPSTPVEKTNPFTGFEDWAKNNVFSPLTIGKGVEAVGKLAMLAGGYDKTVPQYNPFESKIRQLMETRGIDLTQAKQDILSAENAAMGNLDAARSSNVRTALAQNLSNQTASNLARTSMQQQQIKSQQQGEYSQVLNNLGQQRVSAENYAEQLTQQSKAGYQMGLQNILESVGGTGQKVTDYRANIAQQKLINSVLQTKDFKVADPTGAIEKAIRGDEVGISDAVQLTADVTSGAMTPQEAAAKLEELKAQHKQRTTGLTTQSYGGWLRKMKK